MASSKPPNTAREEQAERDDATEREERRDREEGRQARKPEVKESEFRFTDWASL